MNDSTAGKPQAPDGKPKHPGVISSRDLMGPHREIIIEHGSERYRLRRTASDKLILVK
ncbi:MAG TPA: hemin uptake protein HemP [Stellaceae bacterium]|nr:hemin uptake protein HemP [Stellaceae bacterium]